MASKFVSNFGTLLARSAFVVWFVHVSVNRNLRSPSALTRPFPARVMYRHPCITAAQTPHSCCTISPTKSPSKTFRDGSKVSSDSSSPHLPEIQLINSLLAALRTQEELSRRLDHIYRRVQGGPFPPSTGVIRSCASLPPSVVPPTSATTAPSAATATVGIFLYPSSLYVFYVDPIRPTDHVFPGQTFTYGFPFEQFGHTARPYWCRSAKNADWHRTEERKPVDRHTGARQR